MFPPPDWLCETRKGLKLARQEVFKSYEEVRKIREMVCRKKELMLNAQTYS
jgi:hypothetical protein